MIDTHNNPWLGLESYQENQIIYGRNEEISDLAQRVLNDVDTVLYGKSGIGKTSIINAGVLPIARQNGYIPVVVRLDHSNSKKYIGQIRTLIEGVAQVKEKVKAKDPANELLWEYLHRHEFWCNGERCKLLIIFDQFEEIFTLQTDPSARTAFFNEIGDVLNKVMPLELVGKDMEMQQSKADDNETVVEGFASLSGLFKKKIADDSSKTEFDYVDDNDIHFIFALREDFLSDFEYYTAKIPSLKHHRFGLRPLNEEQAADIITKPRPGLVSIDVARLIIETVTGRSDFSLGDDPEIEVDAAVLSLFLSRLYQKLAPEDSIISLQLVTESGSNIIKDFYTESIGILTPQEVVLLEDQLLTSTGRRNNVSYSDFQKLIPKVKINELVQTKKLLRAFNYGNDIRLEFIHDILCPVIKELKSERLAKKKAATGKLFKLPIYIIVCFIIPILRVYPFFSSSDVNIQLIEENTISNDEYWKASISLIDGKDTIAVDTIDKGRPYATFPISNYRKDHVFMCTINPLIGNIKYSQTPIRAKESLNYRIQIDKINPKAFVSGNVRVATGSKQPVAGAIVIWGNQVAKTNNMGTFCFNKPNDYGITSTKDSTIKIIKTGYEMYEDKLHAKNEKYKLQLKNPKEFYDKCNSFESNYSFAKNRANTVGQYIYNGKVAKERIKLYVYKDIGKSSNAIKGFYYYKDRVEKIKDKHSLYILFEGYLKDNGNFVVTSTDDAWNTKILSGKIVSSNVIKGEVYTNNYNYKFEYVADNPLKFENTQ